MSVGQGMLQTHSLVGKMAHGHYQSLNHFSCLLLSYLVLGWLMFFLWRFC